MGDLTKNLSRSEFACEDNCGLDTIDFVLVQTLQDLCNHYEEPGYKVNISITGPNRCQKHNEVVQKKANPMYVPYSSKSLHMDCRAADFKLFKTPISRKEKIQIDPIEIYDYLDQKYPAMFGIGLYHNRNHLDSRTPIFKARWDKTRKKEKNSV